MKVLASLKSRFPKLYPIALATLTLGAVGGIAAYEKYADDCCYPGSPCCHPGAACCAKHKVAAR